MTAETMNELERAETDQRCAAARAIGMLEAMLAWDEIPSHHVEQAKKAIADYDEARRKAHAARMAAIYGGTRVGEYLETAIALDRISREAKKA